jgi:MFS family permease
MNDNRMTGSELRATWGLGTIFSLRMLGMFMVLPVMTTYGMALSGATPTLIGVAIGIYGLTQALFQIPFGLLSDRIGRLPIIVCGLVIFTLGSVIAAQTDSIWGVILGRALQGSGAIAAVLMALLTDLTREQNRTKAMAFIGVSFGVTFAAAMVIGPIVTQAWGLRGLFWGIAALTCLAIVLTLTIIPKPTQRVINRQSSMVKEDFITVLRHPQLLKLNVAILSLHALLMSSFVVLPLTMEKVGILRNEQWKVYLFSMLIAFICVVPFIIYAEKKRRMKQVLLCCITLILTAEAWLYFTEMRQSAWGILLGIQLFFIGFNVLEAILPSWISKEAPAGYRGTAMGAYSTSQFIGTALGAALGGRLYEWSGAGTVFICCFLLAALWLFISSTMQQPPYVSNLRLDLPMLSARQRALLEQKLLALNGITEVVIVAEEQAAYIKIDRQKIDRAKVELVLSE